MASVLMEPNGVRIALTEGEKWAALRRRDLTVPWSEVRSVEAVAEPFGLVQGLRAPGLALPWRTKIGTWHRHGNKTFSATRKGAAGLRITLQHHDFAEILVSAPDPQQLAQQIDARLTADHVHSADPGSAAQRPSA